MSDWGQVGNQSDDSAEKNEKCGEGNLHIIMKVGVIGAGAISDIYLTNMIEKFDNLEVVSIAANHLEHAQEKAEKYGIKACTVKEMLADPEIEMVSGFPVLRFMNIVAGRKEGGENSGINKEQLLSLNKTLNRIRK